MNDHFVTFGPFSEIRYFVSQSNIVIFGNEQVSIISIFTQDDDVSDVSQTIIGQPSYNCDYCNTLKSMMCEWQTYICDCIWQAEVACYSFTLDSDNYNYV